MRKSKNSLFQEQFKNNAFQNLHRKLLEKLRKLPGIQHKRTFATESFKSLNNEFMKYISNQSLHTSYRKCNRQIPYQNTSKSLEGTSVTQYLELWETCTYSEFFWSLFPGLELNTEIPVRMRENIAQKKSEYRHFSRSVGSQISKFIGKF